MADTSGATSVEFALVSVPFLALLFAILETGLVYVAGGTLQSAVVEAGRGIMTGESRTVDRAEFTQIVCNRLVLMTDCANKLSIDVRALRPGQVAARAEAVNSKGEFDTSGWGFEKASSGTAVVVTAAYPWPSIVKLLTTSGPEVLIAATAFKTEQY